MRKVKYIILQLPNDNNNKFKGWDFINTFNIHEYNQVYVGKLETEKKFNIEILEAIFRILNCEHPEDYKTHSLSVSDIIAIYCDIDKTIEYYFCDFGGFKKLPIYNLVEKQIKPLKD